MALATTDLALGNRSDPYQAKIKPDNHAAHDPEHARILPRVVTEDDSKDDAAKVTRRTHDTREDSIGVGMNVRYKREVGAVASF